MDLLGQLSQFYLPGAVPMWCGVLFAIASLWGYTLAAGGDRTALGYARRGYAFYALSIVLAAAVLLLALYRRDFRIEYVYQYSGLELADNFQLAAFWAGQKGSFLIWLVWSALIGIPLSRAAGRDEPTVMWVYLLTQFGLLLILARNNPFVMLPDTPLDGAGLNPLLQDDWMTIHPPVMFIGYASTAIPFSFAVAALWRGNTRNWAARVFPWALGGFLVLGTAILMGGYWAYKTLGWGGFWGWDPVENASLIPWLIGVVFIHGLYLERTRGRYRRLNLLLACLLYMSVLYGTFLTRSGVLADFSVHSFVDLGLSAWLVGLMAVHGTIAFGLLAYRWRSIETGTNEDPLFSRGMMVVMSTILVSLSTIAITVGTSSPLITRWFSDTPSQAGPEFYNVVHLPLALMVAGLLALVPFVTWRETPMNQLGRKLLPSFVVAVILTVIGGVLGLAEPVHFLLVLLASWAMAANLQKVVGLVRVNGLTGAGGYLSHVGVAVMLLGILSSSAYDFSVKVTLPQDEPVRVGDLTLTFERFIPRQGREKERMEVKVVRDDGFAYLAYPKMFVNDRTNQLMVNPHVKKTAFQDFYISPIQFEPPQQRAVEAYLELTKGEVSRVGEMSFNFVDFEVSGMDPAMQLASQGMVEVGGRFTIDYQGEQTPLRAVFRMRSDRSVQSPPVALPNGNMVRFTGVDPQTQAAQFEVSRANAGPVPARLSIDLTKKPLIQLVWFGLYIVLLGGFLSTWKRYKGARDVDAIDDRVRAARAS